MSPQYVGPNPILSLLVTWPIARRENAIQAVLNAHKTNPAQKQTAYRMGAAISEPKNVDEPDIDFRGSCVWKLSANSRKLYPD